MAYTELDLPEGHDDWTDEFSDPKLDLDETERAWEKCYEQRCEQEMLDSVDRVTNMIKTEEDYDRLDFGWDAADDDEIVETVLVKSKLRHGRPSKRVLHPVTNAAATTRRRRFDDRGMRDLIRARMYRCDFRMECIDVCVPRLMNGQDLRDGSVAAALPKNIRWSSNVNRWLTMSVMSDGRFVYVYRKDASVLPRLGRERWLPKDGYHHHPATPNFARRYRG